MPKKKPCRIWVNVLQISKNFPIWNDQIKTKHNPIICLFLVCICRINYIQSKRGVKSFIHSQTLTMQPLKFRNRYVICPTQYWACDYLSMLELKLIRMCKMGPRWRHPKRTKISRQILRHFNVNMVTEFEIPFPWAFLCMHKVSCLNTNTHSVYQAEISMLYSFSLILANDCQVGFFFKIIFLDPCILLSLFTALSLCEFVAKQ